MDAPSEAAGRDHFVALSGAALGSRHQLAGVVRLRGGSKKGVYRLSFDDGSTAIVYSWDAAEDYWPATAAAGDYAEPFSHASGLDLFEAAHRRLEAAGVRTPRLVLADRTRRRYPADVAVIEDVPGHNLEDLFRHDPPRARKALAGLADALHVLGACGGPRFGKVVLVDGGGTSSGSSCEQVVLGRALDDLAEAARRDEEVAAAHDRLERVARRLAAEVAPRARYGLVHGELGPDHVLVDRHGSPVLIDIEGLMYFDVEWEHAFLRLRFDADRYRQLETTGLDPARLAFYKLAMHVSLVAGPMRLLDGDFPDRAFMQGIIEHHRARVLAFGR